MCEEEQFHALERRVDGVEDRLTKVETSLANMRDECAAGFTRVEKHLENIYAEKRAWGEWARSNLPAVGKWLGKWGLIITLSAIGLGNLPAIAKIWTGGASM